MAFHIRNPETDALARKVAERKGVGLTEAVHQALEHELLRDVSKPDLLEFTRKFVKELREKGNPKLGKPADKAFIDSLYEDD